MNLASPSRVQSTIHAAIGVGMGLVFLADMVSPLNMAVWVVYLLPMALAYLVWQPGIPPLLALLTTVLTVFAYFLGPPGGDPAVVAVNRGFGIATAWIIGITGFFFVRSKVSARRQDWLQAGQATLAARMGGEQKLGDLSRNILAFLAEYLGAQAGAIFVRRDEGFGRQAAYGVPDESRLPQTVETGGGLLGEAIRDRRSFLLREVPEGYLYFGSGLGQGRPHELLIAPVRLDEDVNAVVELGFARAHPDSEAFLEQASHSIGVALRSAKYRERLYDLLEETRRQSDELQAQTEELRASNEELEEQSRSLKASQAELEEQQSELEQTNAQLEAQTRILEVQKDDLTHAQSALRAQARDLEQASRYKSEFVANMSHELRTPLNSLLILARLLSENRAGNLQEEQVKFARTIEASGNDLLLLINDILDISKIEAGKLELVPTRERVAPLVEKLAAGFRAMAVEKGLDLRAQIAADAPPDIETDLQRLEQILRNFLSNAVKFTERGEVRLSVTRRPGGQVAFTVRDTGIGIAADQQQAIFEAFRQADGTINRKYGGTGLGLSISRELARLLGGHIEVSSVPGQGSAFTLSIPETYDEGPARAADAGGPRPAPLMIDGPVSAMRQVGEAPVMEPPTRRSGGIEDDRAVLDGKRRVILIVEDDAPFARILHDLVHEIGFQCLAAATADEGVELARQHLPHAIILDMGLPDHTGLSVLDRVKRDTRTRHIPVHVVSVSDYTQTAMSFGAVGYMLKPVKREQLIQALERIDKRFAERLRRILIVEDNVNQLESLKSLLASADVETIGARTAAGALDELRRQTFDCMVLDLSLPDASGFDVLEQLRGDEDTPFPPVIVYTGRDLSAEEELRLRRYSSSIIIKGAKSPERLLDEATLFLHQVVADLPDKQQRMLARSMNRDAAIEGRSILVVEDDVRNVFALTSIFEPHGATVTIARNGLEALAALERAEKGDAEPIDIVLMDLMMPEMDGLTATRAIRARREWRNLPIIALTAKARPEDQAQCLAAGANDYLPKPLDVDKLLSLVRVWMPR